MERCYQVETINPLAAFTPLLPVGPTGVDSLFPMAGSGGQTLSEWGAFD